MTALRSWIRWGGAGAALCALSLLSCKEAVMEPLKVAAVEVAGGGVNLRLGQSTQLTPTLKSAKGYLLPKVGISWSSSDGAKASISQSGEVTAVSRGPVTLTASAGGVNGTAAVTVIGVQSIALAPETLSVIVTQTRAMTATTVLDPGVTVTPVWRSLDTTIARVDTAGRVTARTTTGFARVEVTAEDKKDTAVVRVVPVPVVSVAVSPDTATRTVGQTLQLTATPKDSIGGTLTGRVVTWSSSDSSKVTVSGAGVAMTKAAGSATITATSEGKAGTATITVLVPVATVSVSPSKASVVVGGSQQLTATLKDADGTVLTGRTVTWSSSNTSMATVSSTGLVTAVAAGLSTITANSEGKSSSVALTVTRSANTTIGNYPFDGSLANLGEIGPAVAAFTPTYVADRFARADQAIELKFSSAIGQQNLSLGELRHSGAVTIATWLKIPSASFVSMTMLIAHQPGAGVALQIHQCGSFNTKCKTEGTGYLGVASNWTSDNLSSPANRLVDTTTAITAGEWYHLALTMDSEGTATLYVNGKAVASRAGMSVPAFTTTSAFIGPCEGVPCTAHLDDFRIIAGAGSASTIAGWANDRPASAESSTTITSSNQTSCAITQDNRTMCWGLNGYVGALGYNSSSDTTVSVPIYTVSTQSFSSVTSGTYGSCARAISGSVYCWGSNWYGEAGVGLQDALLPRQIASAATYVSVARGHEHSCALRATGKVDCWGQGNKGNIGDGTFETKWTPTPVATDSLFVQISTHGEHTCALTRGGTAMCWGYGGNLSLGNGSTISQNVPAVVNTEVRFVQVVASSHTCGLSASGEAHCWGANRTGQLGDGTSTTRLTPTKVVTSERFTQLFSGREVTCGINVSKKLFCWGNNEFGTLGDGTKTNRSTPTAVATDLEFWTVGVETDHACAITFDGVGYCWGNNVSGQLGDGTKLSRLVPTRVNTSIAFKRP